MSTITFTQLETSHGWNHREWYGWMLLRPYIWETTTYWRKQYPAHARRQLDRLA